MKRGRNFCFLLFLFSLPLAAYETPTMGWSSWNTYRVNISEEAIKKQAQAMYDKGLGKAGYQYINIDDGYFGGRDAAGNLLIHPTRFPNGLKPVVDFIHGLGFKAGIYSDAGRNTCGSFWDADKIGVGVGMYGHDPSRMRTSSSRSWTLISLRWIFVGETRGRIQRNWI